MSASVNTGKPVHSATFSGPVLTSQTFKKELNQFIQNCSTHAQAVLRGSVPLDRSAPVVHNHYYSSNSWWWYPLWYPQPVVVMPSNRNSDNQGLLVLLGIAAAAVTGVGLYITGSAIGRFQDARAHLQEAIEFKDKLEDYGDRAPQNEQELVDEAKTLVDLQERVTRRIRDSAVFDIACRAALVAGSALLLVGTMLMIVGATTAAASKMAVVGLSVGAAAAGCMLFEWGLNMTEKRNLYDVQEIQESLVRIKQLK